MAMVVLWRKARSMARRKASGSAACELAAAKNVTAANKTGQQIEKCNLTRITIT